MAASPRPAPNNPGYRELRRAGLVRKARAWLAANPKPKRYKGTAWEYAAEKMPRDEGAGVLGVTLAVVGGAIALGMAHNARRDEGGQSPPIVPQDDAPPTSAS